MWIFANTHPNYFIGMCAILFLTIWVVTSLIVSHLNIRRQGWPPRGLDADGTPTRQDNYEHNYE